MKRLLLKWTLDSGVPYSVEFSIYAKEDEQAVRELARGLPECSLLEKTEEWTRVPLAH